MAFFTHRSRLSILLIIFPCLLWGQEEEQLLRRVYDHLVIGDQAAAVYEGKQLLEAYPYSIRAQEAYLESLCQKGEEIEALELFSLLWEKQEESERRKAAEQLAWSVLFKGKASPLFLVHLYSILGSAFAHDAKAVPLLLQEMRGSNAFLRALAVKLSMNYGDEPLRRELLRLLQEERVWFVRLEVIRAVGALRITKAKEQLQTIVGNPRSLAEEKAAAVLSLVHMYETVSQKELEALLHSDRAGLRHLGSELIAHLNLYEEVERLVPLLQDASIDVRLSAMNTLGLLQVKQLKGKATLSYLQSALQDNTPAVSITAAWLALYLGHDEGKQVLKHWMEGGSSEVRRLASAALATLGSLGIEVIVECLQEEKDPYVRVNLALGLIGQRSHIKQACDVLYEALQGSQGVLWMWEEEQNPLFRSLAKSTVSHHEQIPRYPQVVDQMTRLELLSILSTLQYPEALTAVREFLQKQEWGVTGAAASILLQEGDAGALVEVHNLLQDTDEHVRLQAALLLGIVGRDPEAIEVLMTAYPKAGKELKIHILEALGFIGDRKALPFLLDIFQEPFQGLRIVSACSVIQCVNH